MKNKHKILLFLFLSFTTKNSLSQFETLWHAASIFGEGAKNLQSSFILTGKHGFLNAAFNSAASSSVSGLLQPALKKAFLDPKIYIYKGKGKLTKAKISGAFYNAHLQAEVDRYINVLKRLKTKDLKPHFVFRGPPGTGKTLLAKKVAKQSGFSYEFISGASILQFSEAEAIREMSELFDRIERPAKKRSDVTVVIFDEAQDFLMENFRQQRYIMANVNNFMFSRASEPSPNYMFIFTYNSLFPIDERWIRRIDHHLHFDLPDIDTRNNLWNYYLKKEVRKIIKKRGTPEEVKEFDDTLEIASAEFSAESDGFSGSNIGQICKSVATRLKTMRPWQTFDYEMVLLEISNTRNKYNITEIDFGVATDRIRKQPTKKQEVPDGNHNTEN